jgi:hypothetical protein
MLSGIKDLLPGSVASGLATAQGALPTVASGLAAAKEASKGATSLTKDAATLAKNSQVFFSKYGWYIIGFVTILFIGICVGLYFLFKPTPKPNPIAPAAALNAATSNSQPIVSSSGPEGFQMPAVPPQAISAEEMTFINLQPLAIKDVGFIGPYPNGTYDAVTATGNALKGGFRFLTLHIDYMDTSKPGFEKSGEPTLLMRSAGGALMSLNSGSIQDVATTVANLAFRPEVPHNMRPVILYLHVVRAPNPISEPNAYIRFLSKIATAINPIAPMHLGLTPLGNFTRQKMEDTILVTPINNFEGHVMILSNADTSLFRSTTKSTERYDPAQDLDFWVNMRVYLDSEDDNLGITQPADSSVTPSAVIADLNRILNLSAGAASNFAGKSKRRYVIAMPSRTTNPTVKDIDKAINTLGVNAIPIDIFTDTTANVMSIVGEYANMPYHPKPAALRNIS